MVKVMIDKSGFEQGADEARSAAENLADEVDESTGSFDSFTSAVADNIQANIDNEQALSDLEKQIRDSESRLNEIATAVDNVNEEDEDFEQQLSDLQAAYDAELDKLVELGTAYQELQSDTESASSETEDASESFDGAAQKVQAAINKIKTAVKGLVVYKVAKWFWDTTDAVAQYGDAIDKNSQKMGISSKAYQEWSFIAQHAGTNLDSLRSSFRTMANQVESNSKAFEKLGLSLDEVKEMSQEELFEKVIQGLQNMEEGSERTYIANQLLGRGAQELGALLNSSSNDVDAMKSRIEELGGVMSGKAVAQSAAYEDALTDLQTAAQGVKNRIAGVFMEFNTDVINTAANVLGALNRAIDAVTFDSYEEELDNLSGRLEAAKANMEAMKEEGIDSGPVYDAVAQNIANYEARIAELNELIPQTTDALSAQDEKLAELRDSYAATYEAISESLDGWFGAFDNAAYEVNVTFDEMMTNVQSQLAFWQEYEANLKTLADAGFGDLVDAIGEMGPAGAEYAEVLAGMANAGDDGVNKLQELQDAMTQVDDARAEAAATATAIQFTDNSDETLAHVDDVKSALSALNGTHAAVYIDYFDSGANSSAYGRGFAGGIDYVPFHNYPAMLHEGERVLTKEENRRYSEGSGRASSQPIQVNVSAPVVLDGATVARQTYSFMLNLDDAHGVSLIHA